MKYYLLCKNHDNRCCFLENRNSLEFRNDYYDGKLFDLSEPVEVSFNKNIRNKYLPLKNVLVFWGLSDSFVVDEDTMNLLKSRYGELLKFIKARVIDDESAANKIFYILYFCKIISGLDTDKSVIKLKDTDKFVVDENASVSSVFKFEDYIPLTFVDETFKKFVEDNHIEGWTFKKAFEI
jgi:hypothetical protein